MKLFVMWMVIIGMSICMLVSKGWSETVYVVDLVKVTVRSGPGNEHKSVALVESGNSVELVRVEGEWSLIRVGSGTEGFILSRYLTSNPPPKFRLDQLQEKHKSLSAQAAGLLEENQRLKTENEKLAAAVSDGQREVSALRREFETFKKEASEFTELKTNYDELAADLSQKKQTIAQLETQANDLLNPAYFYWFLTGAGVLLVGFLTGFSVRRQRRRSSLV
jgi:SH3 domain protein